jgi:cobyrinic acid a,c-diamide synthase
MNSPNLRLHTPRLIVSGASSGVGKTTIATAIMYLLRKRGLKVQPFKVGPDFIDPSYHSVVTGRKSYNLDLWMMGTKGVVECFRKATFDADVAVIEGVMGLFDGVSGKNDLGSTAHVAKLLDATVLLVLDAGKASGSIAALAYGFLNFDRQIKISGILLNNIASKRHFNAIREAFSNKVKIPIIGAVNRDNNISLTERHLGLVPVAELKNETKNTILTSSRFISKKIKLNTINNLPRKTRDQTLRRRVHHHHPKAEVKIAIAMDESFSFYYADNFDGLERNKAKLIYFSPVNDKMLPEDVSGIILGGGFPEILADKLEKNYLMKNSILKAAEDGMPIYAECGGLMYLTKTIITNEGNKNKKRKMIGLIDADTLMNGRLTLNYTEAINSGPFFTNIRKIRGHEFHYSVVVNIARDSKFAYNLKRGKGIHNKKDGLVLYNCLASYMHIHLGSDDKLPKGIVENCIHFLKR